MQSVLRNVEVHVLVDGHGLEARAVERGFEDTLLLRFGKAAAQVGFEFFHQQRQAFAAAAAMADRLFDGFFENLAVV